MRKLKGKESPVVVVVAVLDVRWSFCLPSNGNVEADDATE
ncbi:hypothetical protein A2U01_0045525, partial [Trifolium medium]|nr:hypothetical protein [Trifolium medium]